MTRVGRRLTAACAVLLSPLAAEARVVFTGYADLRFTAYGYGTTSGPAAVLSSYGVRSAGYRSTGFVTESIGLFATTGIAEGLDFMTDISYVRPGNTASEIRMQYAYLEYTPAADTRLRLGRITVPFGDFNERRFYPFRRHALTAPYFHTHILGVPIADSGLALRQRLRAGPADLTADVYAINGYGSVPGSTSSFRSISLPGGLTAANNLGRTNNNDDLTLGARLAVSPADSGRLEAGASYMRGTWDARDRNVYQLAGAHLTAALGPLELLGEANRLAVEGDQGFAPAVGDSDWHTDGVFVKAAWAFPAGGRLLTPWVRFEDATTAGESAGGGRERLRNYSLGVSYSVDRHLALKAEASRLRYELPLAAAGHLNLDLDLFQVGMTFTY